MNFSAPSPAPSSSESHSSCSPHFMSGGLSLDPSDPLNLLLQNTSQTTSGSSDGDSSMEELSCEGGTPPDWSQLSALWPENNLGLAKSYPGLMDFTDLTSLSMDFNPSMSIEPSALHFDPLKFNDNIDYSYNDQPSFSNEILSAQFPFTFQTPAAATELSSAVTGESAPTYSSDPAAALAERVRQSSGVLLAVPMNAHFQALEENQQAALSTTSNATAAPKLPISRLPHNSARSPQSASAMSSAASTPPPSTPPADSAVCTTGASISPSASTAESPTSTSQPIPLRPKTSHTTIERRYRTNLNARIQSLRMAVPALRVVEDREGGGKKKSFTKGQGKVDGVKQGRAGAADGITAVDVVDERGFVDGVKVARKCSKANVLGKAVEYIRVLKKREHRLKLEQLGLKSLISGLVGGPALLKEWEKEWREKFGGEEKDEVDGEAEADDDDSDEEDEVEEEGRKRKRGKTAGYGAKKAEGEKKLTSPQEATGVTEKRKRGRPRKIVAVVSPVVATSPEDQGQETEPSTIPQQAYAQVDERPQGQPQQYLLATFALFSLFNSPLRSSSTPANASYAYTHTGTVLTALHTPVVEMERAWELKEYLHMCYLLVSAVVLLNFVSGRLRFEFWRNSTYSSWLRPVARKSRKQRRAELVMMAEDCILGGPRQDVPFYTRIQICRHISSWSDASVGELSTAAIVLWGVSGVAGALARAKARAIWGTARTMARAKGGGAKMYEALVLEGMGVDQAVGLLRTDPRQAATGEIGGERSSIQQLGCALVNERVRKHLGSLFVDMASWGVEGWVEDKDREDREDRERQKTIEAAKELGDHIGQVGEALEKMWKLGIDCGMDIEEVPAREDGVEGDIKALLCVLVLYRRVFGSPAGSGPSTLLRPSLGFVPEPLNEVGMLRKALGDRVFEERNGLEDARDQTVDMITALERRGRSNFS